MSLDIACKDTITALSSAPGRGAIAIVRASGPRAFFIFEQIFNRHKGENKNFVAMHGDILNIHKKIIDDAIGLCFPYGFSFTGEESFEIHCHGNPIIVNQILSTIVALGGRLAEPGEFSMRALLNGKIDLAQAESIADLIHAESEAACEAALRGVRGGLAIKCAPIRDSLVRVLAEIEARMDFPDEELGLFDRDNLGAQINNSIGKLDKILQNARAGLRLQDGARLVLVGQPNAGKSTLFNRLLGHDRAIVHESAGTTRDVIEGRMEINGIPVLAIDIAGIRDMAEASPIEQIGINKALLELARADIIIWLADCRLEQPFSDILIEKELSKHNIPVIKILNKRELLPDLKINKYDGLLISAALGEGIEELKACINQLLGQPSLEQVFITRARQCDELALANESLKMARRALSDSMVDEVICSELRVAGLAFDRLFGTTLGEDVLDRIFSEFCIGK